MYMRAFGDGIGYLKATGAVLMFWRPSLKEGATARIMTPDRSQQQKLPIGTQYLIVSTQVSTEPFPYTYYKRWFQIRYENQNIWVGDRNISSTYGNAPINPPTKPPREGRSITVPSKPMLKSPILGELASTPTLLEVTILDLGGDAAGTRVVFTAKDSSGAVAATKTLTWTQASQRSAVSVVLLPGETYTWDCVITNSKGSARSDVFNFTVSPDAELPEEPEKDPTAGLPPEGDKPPREGRGPTSIPWGWIAGGAAALAGLYMMFKKKG